MSAHLIPCGRFANESERLAANMLHSRLNGSAIPGTWYLLTNLSFSASNARLSDELDIVLIGPPGVSIIEVKHWDRDYLRRHPMDVEVEADKLNAKARRLKGYLKNRFNFDFGFIEGRLLLTRSESEKYQDGSERRQCRGVPVFGRPEWKSILQTECSPLLDDAQVTTICHDLKPARAIDPNEPLRTFSEYVDLEALPSHDAPFHQVYRGRRRQSRDRILLHLYDLTASTERNAIEVARREFETLQRLQKSRWLPSLLASFQAAPDYPGEICFFSYMDTEAASLRQWVEDDRWDFPARVRTARMCFQALQDLHGPVTGEEAVLHRNITPETIRVRSNGEPLLTGLQAARLPGTATVAGTLPAPEEAIASYVAPEVKAQGLSAASTASDVYAVCACLRLAFDEDVPQTSRARVLLASGLAEAPASRAKAADLEEAFADLEVEPHSEPPVPPVEFWDEDTVVPFRDRSYRILSRLGSGSVGTTFKVMEVEASGTNADGGRVYADKSGPYVAKVIRHAEVGPEATRAYARVRAQTSAPGLAGVLEVAPEWQPERITALLYWINGEPLSEMIGILPIHFEDLGLASREEMALRWLRDLCAGLASLHGSGLVHGDVSPRNIIMDRDRVTLTDYDLAGSTGETARGGTPMFCAPSVEHRETVCPADDVYALAASLFYVLFDRPPFEVEGMPHKEKGLHWTQGDRDAWPHLATFLDRATHPDPAERFPSALEATAFLEHLLSGETPAEPVLSQAEAVRTPNVVPWLDEILQSFPGSPHGNAETRGLDSEFARDTYVPTELDRLIADDIRSGKVGLVVLCGNAGDGKTAFLQRLAGQLGLQVGTSADRLWDVVTSSGRKVRANLDGSAAWQDRSAEELLDEIFCPFIDGNFPEDVTHLLAINDGPLMAWIDQQDGGSFLAEQMRAGLDGEDVDPRIRFVDLNARSLVGGAQTGAPGVQRSFANTLLDKMLGPDGTWHPCQSCTAQNRCHAWRSVRTLHDEELGPRVRDQFMFALQAVHQRGEVHITARELRAALSFVFFGVHNCRDLHDREDLIPEAYFDRAFNPVSPHRQGDLLGELRLLDPGLETHPLIDRELTRRAIEKGDGQRALPSLRREAYFEWSEANLVRVGGATSALTLARGSHLEAFLAIGMGSDEDRDRICTDLCLGLARLEDLPAQAFERADNVPLKVTPRTPTETIFWVSKPRERFYLRAVQPRTMPGLDTLHTHVELTYTFDNGHEERLIIGADLLHHLLEMRDGYQLTGNQSEDLFANLSVFKQRLAQEGDRAVFAWNPQKDRVFQVAVFPRDGVQKIVLKDVTGEVSG